ncbi:DNA polymerase III subunit epsilon [Candidatus Riesia pediculicola]|uniref:DNA polymerase III subunit epsilon n=1 Tax=Riesia pediculicola (strain USDA) TaxID=515618 RepID=D4G824_RIEPU|nr:DNA polymerase III subunit epsilon [Candidatus Riesia pediculicola]ADD79791.1 DNA polymerase III, epsilon subunit [Candidatus Riesia pediculicola USDA]ARC53731.1 DNA polymerase III subunit epsilon [Candidatus Riesia pediculicola]QOJ86371.1 DNA polymerase III subunit epsilon [Candidatus Riesia pediculicola]
MNVQTERKIILDTETTGMSSSGHPYEGHNIIEIGAVEMINRELTGNLFHVYINPKRSVDPKAFEIHKISDNFLKDKPTFSEIVDDFVDFIRNSELIIHNASFDVGFINHELSRIEYSFCSIKKICRITDTLKIARSLFPGKKNSLDALCDRYHIDRSKRSVHSAILDAKILSEIYKLMTGGQISFNFDHDLEKKENFLNQYYFQRKRKRTRESLVIYANSKEQYCHEFILNTIEKKIGKKTLWRKNKNF